MIQKIRVPCLTYTRRSVTDRLRRLLFTLFLLCSTASGEETSYFLLLYTPGPSWNEALGYEKQPGLKKHHDYLKELHLNDQVVMGGPVVEDIAYDALSVMLLRTGSLEEAQKLAAQDPGMQMRLVRA